ncbi:Gfo/Idh/MocA family oxidoreductase [bacterium]|nr:Gfo/Idh/MocA family oxidoreductase [bacterium]
MKLLVVGCGSIGKRHIGNFQALDVNDICAVDTREDRRREVAAKFGLTKLYGSVEEAFKAEKIDAVVVGAPTSFHTMIARLAVDNGAHVLMEKPISLSMEGLEEVLKDAKKKNLVFMTGYTYRFWPSLIKIKSLLDVNIIGRIYSSHVYFSEYLPDWHPYEDYRSWFMAKKEQGGGAILDESHTIDLARWLFGEIKGVFGFNGHFSHLEITSDDIAELAVQYESGSHGVIHMDIIGRDHHKEVHIVGEKGNIDWDFYSNKIHIYHADSKMHEVMTFHDDRNNMFVDQAKHFIKCTEGKAVPPCDGHDGIKTLKVILATWESVETKRYIEIK